MQIVLQCLHYDKALLVGQADVHMVLQYVAALDDT